MFELLGGVFDCTRLHIFFNPSHQNMNTNEHDIGAENSNTELAQWLPIPSRAVSAIEHPCIIKNVDKGITSLGGSVKLSKVRGQVAALTVHNWWLTCTLGSEIQIGDDRTHRR